MGWLSSLVGAAVPQLGLALKLGPYLVIGALAVFALVQHEEISTARAQTQVAQAATKLAVSTCQQEAATEAAKENAAAVASIQAAQAAAQKATVDLTASRQAAASAATAGAAALATELSTIDAQTGKQAVDGPIPPILAEQFP